MKRLTGTDSLFLAMETPDWHQHVGGLTILEPGETPVTYERMLKTIEARLPLAPKFHWKLKSVPLHVDIPGWVDDPDFDVRNHVRRIAVPTPGGPREVGEVVGMLMSMQLDRRRPLWELWFLEGVAHGRVGLFMKYHHCLLDGVAGASLATALMDLEPDATGPLLPPPPPEEATAGPEPHTARLLVEALLPNLRRPLRLAQYLGTAALRGVTMADRLRNPRNRVVLGAPKTPWNDAIGPRRELAFASVAMADVHRVKEQHGVKINDVVIALCAEALRGYLMEHGLLPDEPLVTAMPISTRPAGDTSANNQIATMFVSMATDVEDPVERLHEIASSTASAKEMQKALSARQIQSLGEIAAPLILGTAIRALHTAGVVSKLPFRVNTIVSNVPGPPVALYTCGAKVTGIYPSSVIMESMGLNLTVFSYQDRIDFGIQVDPDLVPDVWKVADGIPRGLAELLTASGLGEPTPVADPFAPAPAGTEAADRVDAPV